MQEAVWGPSSNTTTIADDRLQKENSAAEVNPETVPDCGTADREEGLKLVQQLFFSASNETIRNVVFSGIEHGNGCTHVCARAARILAEQVSGSVCLVEGNFRSPAIAELFGIAEANGRRSSVSHEGPIRNFATQSHYPRNLWVLPAGPMSLNVVSTERLQQRLLDLRRAFDYVLIDAPPLGPYVDAANLGRLADGLVVIVTANSTRRDSTLKAIDALKAAEVRILGAVLNKRTFPIPRFLHDKL